MWLTRVEFGRMEDLLKNVGLLCHGSHIVRISGRKKIENFLAEKNDEAFVTALLELVTAENVDIVSSMVQSIDQTLILQAVLSLLPHSQNTTQLFQIVFNIEWEENTEGKINY